MQKQIEKIWRKYQSLCRELHEKGLDYFVQTCNKLEVLWRNDNPRFKDAHYFFILLGWEAQKEFKSVEVVDWLFEKFLDSIFIPLSDWLKYAMHIDLIYMMEVLSALLSVLDKMKSNVDKGATDDEQGA